MAKRSVPTAGPSAASLTDGQSVEARIGSWGCIAAQWNKWRIVKVRVVTDARGNPTHVHVPDGNDVMHPFVLASILPQGRKGSMLVFEDRAANRILQVRGVVLP
jgi:hypothetical protein